MDNVSKNSKAQSMKKEHSSQSNIKSLWMYLKLLDNRLILYLTGIIGMTVSYAIFDVICALLMKNVFDIAQNQNSDNFYSVIWTNIIIGVICAALFVIFMNMYNNEAKRGALKIKKDVFDKALKLPISYYDQHHSGDVLTKLIYDTDKANGIYSSRLRRVLAPILFVIVYMIAMLIFNPAMTLCLILINIVLFLVNATLAKPMKRIGKELSKKNASMSEKLLNIIGGIETIKMFDKSDKNVKQYKEANEEYTKIQKHKMVLDSILDSCNVGFDLLCALMFLVIGVVFIENHLTTIGNVVAIYSMYGVLSARFLTLGRYYPELVNCIAYTERIFEFLSEREESDYTLVEQKNLSEIDYSCDSAIEINDLEFSYDDSHQVFKHFSAQIPTGKNVAIIGESGCGKSTLAKLILGFYPYKTGKIKYFGNTVETLGLGNVRKLIAYVPQEPYLFETTILENIRYGRMDATEEEICEAARLANADIFIKNQEKGYDTLITNRGLSLSGGERQRIAIARAIIKNSPIILFDEATSALDNESESLIQISIEQLKKTKTFITIAHRKTTINNADVIIEL